MMMVVVDPDPAWLAERAARGVDHRDEVWDGVLHVPPEPTVDHQRFESRLERALFTLCDALGFEVLHEIAVYDPEKGSKNYRTPDVIVARPGSFSKRGLDGPAELVVEVLSPNDESRLKFGFYAARRIPEYWIVDPNTREIEVYVLRGDTYFAVTPDRQGVIHAPQLGLELRVVEGPKLRIAWADGSADI